MSAMIFIAVHAANKQYIARPPNGYQGVFIKKIRTHKYFGVPLSKDSAECAPPPVQQNTTRDITFGTRWEQTPFTAWQTSANQLLPLIVYLDMPIYRRGASKRDTNNLCNSVEMRHLKPISFTSCWLPPACTSSVGMRQAAAHDDDSVYVRTRKPPTRILSLIVDCSHHHCAAMITG